MIPNPDIRWIQRLNSFRKAFAQLSAGADLAEERELSTLERQGLIHAFEVTHELAWNVMKDYLAAHGASVKMVGSRDAVRAAYAADLLRDGEVWLEMIGSRNLTSHSYNEETADEVEDLILNNYVGRFAEFEATMSELQQEEK